MDGKGEVASEAGSGGGSGLGWQGVPGRHEATCHPGLGGACEAVDFVCRAGGGLRCRPGTRRQRDEGAEEAAGGGGGMAGARATLGIVRGGTVNGSERWGRAQRDGSGRPARRPWQKGRKRGAVARHAALGRRAGKEGPLPGTPPAAEGLERAADGWLEELAK